MIQNRDEGFANGKIGNDLFRIESGVHAERFGRCTNRFLLFRRIGAQGMLNPVAELSQHIIGNICGALGNEIYANTFGPNETGNLFNFIHQRFWRVLKQEMRLVKEKDHLGFFWIADLGKFLE